jgi:mono/diheme cytochrome c family protein
MSSSPNPDPRIDQAAVTDESLLTTHEKLLGKQPDEKAHYRLMPLNLLFIFSGLIFFAGTYLNKYSAHFNPHAYNEEVPEGMLGKGAAPAAPADPIEVGKKGYNAAGACVTCHLPTGLGQPGAIPPLAGSEWAVGSEERMIRIALYGLQGPITVKGTNFSSAMPAFGKVAGSGFNFSDERIAAILTYVRQEWGNQAPPVTKEKVAEIHNKEGDRKAYTADELSKLP